MSLHEVSLLTVSPERFRAVVDGEFTEVESVLERARPALDGRTIWHVNSTARGGGVAEMLRSYLAYVRGAGVEVRWMVADGNPGFFAVTKRIHNNLHGDPGDGGPLGEPERATYDDALAGTAGELSEMVSPGDIVFLHDPQTAGLVASMKERGALVVWRCHVGVDRPNDIVRRVWDFLRGYLEPADALVFSRAEFVWSGLNGARVTLMPPTIDVFAPKNQQMAPGAVAAILGVTGLAPPTEGQPVFERADGSQGLVGRPAVVEQEGMLEPEAPAVVQVSRWDRLKDPVGLLECFAHHVSASDAHLVIAGPDVDAVDDDPEGAECLREVRAALTELPEGVRGRVHLVSLPMDDLEENAAMVNALQRRAQVVVQKSVAEGFGLTVAEAMWKSRPVVAGRVGGIQDQIVDGESGVLVDDPSDLAAVGAAIDGLLADPGRAEAVGAAARRRVITHFLQVRRLLEYFELIERLMGVRRMIDSECRGGATGAETSRASTGAVRLTNSSRSERFRFRGSRVALQT